MNKLLIIFEVQNVLVYAKKRGNISKNFGLNNQIQPIGKDVHFEYY